MDELHPAQDRQAAELSTAENVRVPNSRGQYLTVRGLFRFSRRTLIHFVSGQIIKEERGR